MKGTKRKEEFSLEGQIGKFGLKSKIKIGFIPGLHQASLDSHTYPPSYFSEDPRGFYLGLLLRCPADIKKWKREGSALRSGTLFGVGEGTESRYWFRSSSSELKKLIRSCSALSECCGSLRLEEVIKELKMKAFWFKVVGENE